MHFRNNAIFNSVNLCGRFESHLSAAKGRLATEKSTTRGNVFNEPLATYADAGRRFPFPSNRAGWFA